jgi:hypothetical protein
LILPSFLLESTDPPPLPLLLLVVVPLLLVLLPLPLPLLLLPLPLVLMVLCVHPCWHPGLCAPTLCLSFSLLYLTCNRIVNFLLFILYLPFDSGFNLSAKQMNC